MLHLAATRAEFPDNHTAPNELLIRTSGNPDPLNDMEPAVDRSTTGKDAGGSQAVSEGWPSTLFN